MVKDLECYLVGGAVRDELLGRAVVDRDWVVVGSTPDEMERLGFNKVGRDFPVYLHPHTHDEYALARTERKQGSGHRGFAIDADPGVTLEEDLGRRDLTINAIAKNSAGALIDPHQGVADIRACTLRHVSLAFADDPLRVFRVARFAAQLPGFALAPATQHLMQKMVADGELRTLSAERVWQELCKALAAPAPIRFFEVLQACDGLGDWLFEIKVDRLTFNTATARHRFAELALDENEFKALATRLVTPGIYLQGALDYLSWPGTLVAWRTVSGGQLNDAFMALKFMHGEERLVWLTDFLRELSGAELAPLLALARGWRGVRIEPGDLSGRAYGEALLNARVDWLEQQRPT